MPWSGSVPFRQTCPREYHYFPRQHVLVLVRRWLRVERVSVTSANREGLRERGGVARSGVEFLSEESGVELLSESLDHLSVVPP